MSRKRRDMRAAANPRIIGSKTFFDEDGKIEAMFFFRDRKARRAEARLQGLNWRELSEQKRLNL